MTSLALDFGLDFNDLYTREGLVKLDRAFIEFLSHGHADIHNRLVTARENPDALNAKDESNL
ncbi:MAG: hypothetical protein K0R63_1440, partial [Rickettsiales bacterium]|nr:hypothetical protein [Rickettsiales bacterium]